jgi:hypothetical protein
MVKFMLWPHVGLTQKIPNLVEISFVVSEMQHADKCNLSFICSFCGHLQKKCNLKYGGIINFVSIICRYGNGIYSFYRC